MAHPVHIDERFIFQLVNMSKAHHATFTLCGKLLVVIDFKRRRELKSLEIILERRVKVASHEYLLMMN